MALIVGSYLRMDENSDFANQPMLPVMRGDDRDALDVLLVVFYEAGMFFKGRDILPAVETGSIDQQSDFALLTDERIDLRSNLVKSSAFNLFGATIFNALVR